MIEMNLHASRLPALVSNASGLPTAKRAAKHSIGLSLAELRNNITKEAQPYFEASLHLTVRKVSRLPFQMIGGANATLSAKMRAFCEVMEIGRTFT